GTINAQGGQVLLTAAAAETVVNSLVNMNGLIDVSGQTGGSVTITGNTVTVGGTLNASGTNGGGSVKIGGDFHGQGSTPHAQYTTIEQGAVIDASAITSGDGGKVA